MAFLKRFPPDWLDWFRCKVSIEDVISRFVELERHIGFGSIELVGGCPFPSHKKDKRSFVVVPHKGFYHCFGCGAHGDVIKFLMYTNKEGGFTEGPFSLSFVQAVAVLSKHAGICFRPPLSGEPPDNFGELHDLPPCIPYRPSRGVRRAAQPFLEKIQATLSLESLVSEHVVLQRRGKRFVGSCPFHHEKTPSFFVIPAEATTECRGRVRTTKHGFYRCQGCGARGNHFTFLQRFLWKKEERRISFREVVLILAKRAGVEAPSKIIKALE